MKVFSMLREHLRKRFDQPDGLDKSDLIFVLAGHSNRKVFGAKLFRDGWAPRVLLSTGDPPYIARLLNKEIMGDSRRNAQVWTRVLETAKSSSPLEGHYFAGLDDSEWSVEPIPVRFFGTLSEIKALGRWLQRRPAIRSLLIVSSGLHLERVRICCHKLLPPVCRFRLAAVPADIEDLSPNARKREREGFDRVLLECCKIALYRGILAVLRK